MIVHWRKIEVSEESFDGVSDSFALIGFDSIFDCPEMDYPPVNQYDDGQFFCEIHLQMIVFL